MTERLPNIGEEDWANILGANDGSDGFLRVAHNDDGTPKYPGSSYLMAIAPNQTGVTGSTFATPIWTGEPVGSDIEIDSGDATRINILTDGWYEATFKYLLQINGTDYATGVGADIYTDAANVAEFTLGFASPAAQLAQWNDTITTGAIPLSSGQYVGADVTMSNSGTYDALGFILKLVRMG